MSAQIDRLRTIVKDNDSSYPLWIAPAAIFGLSAVAAAMAGSARWTGIFAVLFCPAALFLYYKLGTLRKAVYHCPSCSATQLLYTDWVCSNCRHEHTTSFRYPRTYVQPCVNCKRLAAGLFCPSCNTVVPFEGKSGRYAARSPDVIAYFPGRPPPPKERFQPPKRLVDPIPPDIDKDLH